ncbi:MAG: hypothetical protein DMF54_08025 [Acidobacteria bacterium]|nr:MAG: hypothetical protein DMF54_08025 [Acidobacteriota bacterium]
MPVDAGSSKRTRGRPAGSRSRRGGDLGRSRDTARRDRVGPPPGSRAARDPRHGTRAGVRRPGAPGRRPVRHPLRADLVRGPGPGVVQVEGRPLGRRAAARPRVLLSTGRPGRLPDIAAEKRFAQNPLVAGDPGLRFYAGAPLSTSDGFAVGALSVLDSEPRQLSTEQLEGLRVLARQVTALLELRRLRRSEREQSGEKLMLEAAGLSDREPTGPQMEKLQ